MVKELLAPPNDWIFYVWK